jgi:hypothetical protein
MVPAPAAGAGRGDGGGANGAEKRALRFLGSRVSGACRPSPDMRSVPSGTAAAQRLAMVGDARDRLRSRRPSHAEALTDGLPAWRSVRASDTASVVGGMPVSGLL